MCSCVICAQWCVCIGLYVSLFATDASGKIIVSIVMCVFDNFFRVFVV